MLLVADANECFANAVSARAQACGWQVMTVRDGEAALSALHLGHVTVAIVHAGLPGVNAGEVAAVGRRSSLPPKVVFFHDHELGMTEHLRLPEVLCTVRKDALLDALPAILLGHAPAPAPVHSPVELVAQSPVRLSVVSGRLAGTHEGIVVESDAHHVCISAWDEDGSAIDLSLGTRVTVGFAGPKGWGELASTVTGSYVRGSVIELTLLRSAETFYRQRRKAERYIATFPIWAWPAEGTDASGRMASGRTEDIGREGLRACFSTPLAFDGRAVLSVAAGRSSRASRLLADTVWHESVPGTGESRYGFRFASPGAATAQSLEDLLGAARSWGNLRSVQPGRVAPEDAPRRPDGSTG
jgi:CheY-like chemotaxis protein